MNFFKSKLKNNKKQDEEEIVWSKPLEEEDDKNKKSGWGKTLNFLGFEKNNNQINKDLSVIRKEMIKEIKLSPKKESDDFKNKEKNKHFSFNMPNFHELHLKNKEDQAVKPSGGHSLNENKKIFKNSPENKKEKSELKKSDFSEEIFKNSINASKKNIDDKKNEKFVKSNENNNDLKFNPFKLLNDKLSDYKKIRRDFYKIKKDETDKPLNKEKNDNKEKLSQADEWGGAGLLNTNLIKDSYLPIFNWQGNLILLSIGILFALIVLSGSFFSIVYFEQSREAEKQAYQKTLNSLQEKIDKAKNDLDKAKEVSSKIKKVKILLDNHVYWSNFFKFLENNTLPDVYYSGFAGETKGEYSLAATTKDFLTMQSQIKQFKASEDVQSVVSEVGRKEKTDDKGQGKVSFDLNLKINPKIFFEK